MKSALINCKWLKENIGKVRIFDCTWYFPNKKPGLEVFLEERIPTSSYIDLEAISDPTTHLPHQLPSVEHWNDYFSNLGLRSDDDIVFYDQEGSHYVTPRMYYMFRKYGHDGELHILDGGLPAWKTENFEIEKGNPKEYPKHKYENDISKQEDFFLGDIDVVFNRMEEIENKKSEGIYILDARSPGRFAGTDPEPRKNVESGSIPGSNNIFFKTLWDEDRKLLKKQDLKKRFEEENISIDDNSDFILCCGSGVTGCVLALALEECSVKNFKVFDGSWTQYATTEGVKIIKDLE